MERNRLYGVGEPITMRHLHGGLDAMKALELADAVGFTALREWMHIPLILSAPATPIPDAVRAYTRTLDRCREMDIEVTGMSHNWFLPPECGESGGCAMPPRDTAPGSVYMRALEMLETSWRTLAGLFPQVAQWEVGNEWNIEFFLHPAGWQFGQPGFTLDEAMDIAVDMMYYAARGIRAGNPDARVVSFSPTLGMGQGNLPYFVPMNYGIAHALEKVYQRIASGAFPSTRTDDYFDMLAWHPYLLTEMMDAESLAARLPKEPQAAWMWQEQPDALWKAYSDAAYRVMLQHGDGHKQVLLTEFGFSDCGDPERERQQAGLFERAFETLARMPYVRTVHTFRLFEQENAHAFPSEQPMKVNPEIYFGFFREAHHGYAPRNKARVLQRICGGTRPLE